MGQAKIGLIGLAVMGANLARNLAGKQIATLVYNRTEAKTRQFMQAFGSDANLTAAYSLEELVEKLERPRKMILMVKAGAPVDALLDKLLPLLDKGDIVIDGGNSLSAWESAAVRKGHCTAPVLCRGAVKKLSCSWSRFCVLLPPKRGIAGRSLA